MQQVPADRVIALLTTEIADLHREMAILKVQVQLLEEDAASTPNHAAQAPSLPAPALAPDTTVSPSLPPLPATSSAA